MSTYDFEPNPDHYGPEPAHIANGTHKKNLLVTPPKREWVGLTQQDWDDLYKEHHDRYGYARSALGLGYEEAIEAKIKEKNQ
jgi:hypothetical protein